MDFITNFYFYAVAIPALLIVGISKGRFGGSLGVVGVPIMSLMVSPEVAAAIMLPVLCLMDTLNLWVYRKQWDKRIMLMIFPGAVVGVIIGTIFFSYAREATIEFFVALIAIVFTINYWLKNDSQPGKKIVAKWSKGGFWGVISGFTSFIAHAGGPALSVFLLPLRLQKIWYAGTTAIFYGAINYLKAFVYWRLGQFNTSNLATAIVLMPVAFIGIGLGVWLRDKVNERLFYRVCYVLLFITGLKLLYDALPELF